MAQFIYGLLVITTQLMFNSQAYAKLDFAEAITAHNNLSLINDSPNYNTTAYLFHGDSDASRLQYEFIRANPTANFVYILSQGEAIDSYISLIKDQPNVTLLTTPYKMNYWARDRYFHFMAGNNNAVIFPVLSPLMYDDDAIATFSLTFPKLLQSETNYVTNLGSAYNDKYIQPVAIDKGNGYPYPGSTQPSFAAGENWLLGYGDGGDRISTESVLFIGSNTVSQWSRIVTSRVELAPGQTAVQFIEQLTKKKLVSIGNPLSDSLADQYWYHIDLFMTPLQMDSGTKILIGSLPFTRRALFGNKPIADLPSWVDKRNWEKKEKIITAIIDKLKADGFDVIETPILPLDLPGQPGFSKRGVVTFNNGIFSQGQFFTGDYIFENQEINRKVQQFRNIFTRAMRRANSKVQVHFLPGAEQVMFNGGSLRCLTAPLSQQPVPGF